MGLLSAHLRLAMNTCRFAPMPHSQCNSQKKASSVYFFFFYQLNILLDQSDGGPTIIKDCTVNLREKF